MLDSAVDKRSLRVLISSYDFPPIPYDLAEAFNRAGVEVSLLITSYGTEPPFFRYLIKCVNKPTKNKQIVPNNNKPLNNIFLFKFFNT